MNKIVTLVHDSLEFLIISILVTAAGLFIGGWKKNMEYPVAAIILGTVFGAVAAATPMLEAFKFIAAVLGAAVGPKTLAAMQNKTLKDVLNDYLKKEIKDAQKEDPKE